MPNRIIHPGATTSMNRIAVLLLVTVFSIPTVGEAQRYVALSGGATVGDLGTGTSTSTDSRWGGTAGVSVQFVNWNCFIILTIYTI